MSFANGVLIGAAQLGLEAIMVRPKRAIGAFTAYVTIEETHQDDLEITDHPVELGAAITDHSFKLPASVTIRLGVPNYPLTTNLLQSAAAAVTGTVNGAIGVANQVSAAVGGPAFSNVTGNQAKNIKQIYQDLLKMQSDRTLLDIYTGKRAYNNMLIKSIVEQTNLDTENALIVTITFRQVLIVSSQTLKLGAAGLNVDSKAQANPQKTAVSTDAGIKQLIPGGLYFQ